MNKLIMTVAVVAAAVIANAGTVQWSSGALKTANGSSGGWSTTGVNVGSDVTMQVFLVDDTTYASFATMSQQDLYDWASGQTASYSGVNKNSSGGRIGAITIKTTDLNASTDYYTLVLASYTDATYGEMFMAQKSTFKTASNGDKTVSNILATTSGPTVSGGWQAVPEPTSGLLLLLGMAGLALRRRRA